MKTLVSERFVVTGVVQGVGFRPYVYRLATELGLTGEVGNSASDVFVLVSGTADELDRFEHRLRSEQPPLARIDSIMRSDTKGSVPKSVIGFRIAESVESDGPRTLVSPDTAVCDDCIAEMTNPEDRRYGHPFITCTNCGPRFTIIRDLPYDRPATGMADFPMCQACAAEYRDPADRRYHAQPIACHDCGPTLRYENACDPIAAAAAGIEAGLIVAIKGIGGFHLACDATNAEVIATLRRRKHRPDKPFAVMVPDLGTAAQIAHLSKDEVDLLGSPARPVVLAPVRPGSSLASAVAPGNPLVGLMLPYTPVHYLLFAQGLGPLVMTSGNVGGEPIVYRDHDVGRLSNLVDGVLTHDRPIEVPCDDSIVRVLGGALMPIRRARGYAPLPVPMPHASRDVFAVGGELKNTFTVVADGQAWVGQHIGDMENLQTLRAFERSSDRLVDFYQATPEVMAVDSHPGYATSRWAKTQNTESVEVQHHHAHIASVMAEHQLDPHTEVLGFAFDGTGYGTDGTIWGGEVLRASPFGFERVAHLASVNLPGGDGAVRFPNRMALAHLHAAGIGWDTDLEVVQSLTDSERQLLATQLEVELGCVPCTSMGRLFDAVASLIGLRHEISYEAQAAIELEFAATRSVGARRYGFDFDGECFDAAPVLRSIVTDVLAGIDQGPMAAGFHNAVADVVAEVVSEFLDEGHAPLPIVLTGGCFQNALLLGLCRERLERLGVAVLTHTIVPPNDGGLSLGQAFIVAHTKEN